MWEELLAGLWMVLLVVFGGALGIAGLGTLLATISVNTSGKDFILTVLFIPLIYPLLLGAALQLAEQIGARWTVFLGGIVCLAAALVLPLLSG